MAHTHPKNTQVPPPPLRGKLAVGSLVLLVWGWFILVKEREKVSGKVSNQSFVIKISCLANSPSVYIYTVMHQSIPGAPPPPSPATAGHFPVLWVPGVGHLQILHCPGARHLPTRALSWAFDMHAVSYQNITTQKVLLEKKQIGSSVKDRNRL